MRVKLTLLVFHGFLQNRNVFREIEADLSKKIKKPWVSGGVG